MFLETQKPPCGGIFRRANTVCQPLVVPLVCKIIIFGYQGVYQKSLIEVKGVYPYEKTKKKRGYAHRVHIPPRVGELVALLATGALLVVGPGGVLGRLLRGLLVESRSGRRRLGHLGQRLGLAQGPRLATLVSLPLPALEVAGRQRRHDRTRARRRTGHDGLRRDRPGTNLARRAGELVFEDLELLRQRVQERNTEEPRHVPHARTAGDELTELEDRGQLPLGEIQLTLDLPNPQHETLLGQHLALVHEAQERALHQRLDLRDERPERGLDHHLRGHMPPP